MDNLLEKLNPEQAEAVCATEGFIRVVAGAGSGKTRALSHRFAFLVNEIGILPGNILCVTFTNKSANEMRQRIHMLTGDNDTGYINTFHGFCVSVLQEDSYAVAYPKSFLVLDNSDIDTMLSIIYEERGLTLRDMTYAQARNMFEMRKCITEPNYYLDMITMSLETLHEKYLQATRTEDILFYGYLYQEKKCFGLDYNDLIKFTLYIFEQEPQIRLKWQQRLEYIMIDEFQDIDPLQYRLMEVLCGFHKNLFIVGDPDQTIYTWRGANVRYLLHFDSAFPGTKTIMMMTNYRSTPQILSAANALIEKNTERIKKELIPTLEDGPSVLCMHAESSKAEGAWIAGEMKKLHESGVAWRDMTVLYRAHYVSRTVEEALMKEKIPYTIYSGVQFFARQEIRDTLAYLRMIIYQDDLSFLRIINVPKRNIGKRRIAYLQETAKAEQTTLYETLQNHLDEDVFSGTQAEEFVKLMDSFKKTYTGRPISEVLAAILNDSGYEKMLRTEGSQERLDNLAELKQSVYEYETTSGEECTLEDYLRHVALFTNTDMADSGDKIRMMTVHTAKGLEFPYVFLCGMNEGIFPSRKIRTIQGMEEERRLAFVAVTRAKTRLFLSEADGRNFDGSPRYPSRFLLDIGKERLEYVQPPQEGLLKDAKAFIETNERLLTSGDEKLMLTIGTRVKHTIFGEGAVLNLDLEKNAYVIQFDKISTPRTISFKARLEAVNPMPAEGMREGDGDGNGEDAENV